MDIAVAEQTSRVLVSEYLGANWKVSISPFPTLFLAHAQCIPLAKKIIFSPFSFAVMNESEVNNTILHEIAHGLVPWWHKHDKEWKNTFIKIGGNGEKVGRVSASSAEYKERMVYYVRKYRQESWSTS